MTIRRTAKLASFVMTFAGCTVHSAPTGSWYELSPVSRGDSAVLDVYSGNPPNEAFISKPGSSGSAWRIAPVGTEQYRLTDQFLGLERALAAYPDGHELFMGDTADVPAQRWSIVKFGDNGFRFTTPHSARVVRSKSELVHRNRSWARVQTFPDSSGRSIDFRLERLRRRRDSRVSSVGVSGFETRNSVTATDCARPA